MSQSPSRSDTVGRGFGHLGLAVTVVLALLPFLLLTIAFPPWREVECQRRQTLYWSERIAIRKTSFAGFDWLFSGPKWTTTKNPPNPSSEMLFESHEFEVHRPVLAVEWLLLVGVAGTAWYRVAQRVFPSVLPRDESPPTGGPAGG
jgi:hypothetical protein